MKVLAALLLLVGAVNGRSITLTPTSIPVTIVPLPSQTSAQEAFLVIDVAVGNPPQRMNLTVDESQDISILFDSNPAANTQCYSFASRNYFDGRASRTFNQTKKLYGTDGSWLIAWPYTIDCVPGMWGPSDVSVDTWQIGAAPSTKLPFMYGRNLSSYLSPSWKSDGIFGLNFGWKGDGRTWVPLLAQYPEKVVSVYLQRQPALVTAPTPAGVLTIGGKDNQHCAQWTTLPFDADSLGFWGVEFDSARLGSAIFKTALDANFVLTTEYIRTADFPDIVKVLGAEYDFRSDYYTVDCDAIDRLPDLVFNLAGTDFPLPASDYTRKMAGDKRNRCALLIEDSIDPDSWTLGTTFLRSYCLALDFQHFQVVLGKTV